MKKLIIMMLLLFNLAFSYEVLYFIRFTDKYNSLDNNKITEVRNGIEIYNLLNIEKIIKKKKKQGYRVVQFCPVVFVEKAEIFVLLEKTENKKK